MMLPAQRTKVPPALTGFQPLSEPVSPYENIRKSRQQARGARNDSGVPQALADSPDPRERNTFRRPALSHGFRLPFSL